ncbi:MAG: hypothetical protein WCU88_08615 [Elusimicrobiota bacterium]
MARILLSALFSLATPQLHAQPALSSYSEERGSRITRSLDAHAAALGISQYEALPAVIAAPYSKNLLLIARDDAGPKQAFAPAIEDAQAVPWTQIEAYIRFEDPGALPSPDDLIGRIKYALLQQLPQARAARKLARAAIERMQETPEGREVLGELLEECARRNEPLLISAVDVPGSIIDASGRIEEISGTLSEADPHGRTVDFNKLYLDFADKDAAVKDLAGALAHEFQHIVNAALAQGMPGFPSLLINEQLAWLTGYLVDARLAKGAPSSRLEAAKNLAQSPDAYWDSLKSQGGYADKLDMAEAQDPVDAYRQRLGRVSEAWAQSYADLLSARRTLAALSVLREKEGMGDALTLLHTAARVQSITREGELSRLSTASHKIQSFLDSERRPLLRESDALVLGAFEERLRRDQLRLEELLREKSLPGIHRPEGQLTWENFRALVKKSAQEHPEYWMEFKRDYGDPDSAWTERPQE